MGPRYKEHREGEPAGSIFYLIPSVQHGKFKLKKSEVKKVKNPSVKTCQGCSVREYFKDVDDDVKEELKTLFRIDFEMFGYSEDDIWCYIVQFVSVWNSFEILKPGPTYLLI